MNTQKIRVPDIGADSAQVTEILVAVGDDLQTEQSLLVLESDKASVEVPAPLSGRVRTILVTEGQQVAEGTELLEVEVAADSTDPASSEAPQKPAEPAATEQSNDAPEPQESQTPPPESPPPVTTETRFQVPDLGADQAEVTEILVTTGQQITAGDSLLVAESEKASVEIPAPASGQIIALHLNTGDKIKQGQDMLTLQVAAQPATKTAEESAPPKEPPQTTTQPPTTQTAPQEPPTAAPPPATAPQPTAPSDPTNPIHAGPAVRKLARQLGVDLSQVTPSGPHNRILKADLHTHVKSKLAQPPATAGQGTATAAIPPVPDTDWSQFGPITTQPISRIGQLTAQAMTRNWLNVPHVTQFDHADVTDLEQYRAYLKPEAKSRGIKMTPLAFLLRATATALRENPKFNSALHPGGQKLTQRNYYHIAVAVDTPAGLMVPVLRDVDQKDIWTLAAELADLATKAKQNRLTPRDFQGGCFTISSLGAIGGNGFTPIVSAPQVGILGVSRTSIQPVWNGTEFTPRKLMPLALSYDHRAVNGADAGRFLTTLTTTLPNLDQIWNT